MICSFSTFNMLRRNDEIVMKVYHHNKRNMALIFVDHSQVVNKQEIAANYEKYIRARDPFP